MGSTDLRTLTLHGAVDLTSAPSYLEQCTALLEDERTGTLRIDLSDADFMDSQGVAFLIQARTLAERKGVDVRLAAVPARIRRVLQITGLEPVFSFEN